MTLDDESKAPGSTPGPHLESFTEDDLNSRDSSIPLLVIMILIVISPLIFYAIRDCG